METNYEKVKALMDKRRKNLSCMSKEDQQGRYKKALDKLWNEINEASHDLMLEFIFGHMKIHNSDVAEMNPAVMKDWEELAAKEKNAGTFRRMKQFLIAGSTPGCGTEDTDMFCRELDQFVVECSRMGEVLESMPAYMNYWQKHCHANEQGLVYNDLIDMWWSNERPYWYRDFVDTNGVPRTALGWSYPEYHPSANDPESENPESDVLKSAA